MLKDAFPELAHLNLPRVFVVLVAVSMRNRQTYSQDLFDFLEGNAGAANITKACRRHGFNSWGLDRSFDAELDHSQGRGCRFWIQSALLLRDGGMYWLAPQCSSWIWISRGYHRRSSACPLGDESVWQTAQANADTYFYCCLMLLLQLINAGFVLEQPLSSLFSSVDHVAATMECAKVHRQITWLGAFGAVSPKCVKLFSNRSWVKGLYRKRPKMHSGLVRRKGNKVWGNTQMLKSFQVYPVAFGEAVAAGFGRSDVSSTE